MKKICDILYTKKDLNKFDVFIHRWFMRYNNFRYYKFIC